MVSLKQYQQNLQKLSNPKVLELMLFIEVKRYENIFINTQKKQLSKGQDNEGVEIGVYSEATEAIAANENPRKPKIAGEPYNFEYTGSFYDGMELRVDGTQAEFWSTDGKTDELVVKYDNLFGLQKDNLREIIQLVILPAFLLQFRKDLGL